MISYIPNISSLFEENDSLTKWINSITWLEETSARKECFMSDGGGISYTYGEGRGKRTYTSIDYNPVVKMILSTVNEILKDDGPLNGCFLNLYETERNALGWHADDFEKMDHSKSVAVVSFGEAREIWWRKTGERGVVPDSNKQLLASGSLFIMPPGFQYTHEHRIPKGSRAMGRRVSLTFRAFA